MGQDLITHNWTIDPERDIHADAVRARIAAIDPLDPDLGINIDDVCPVDGDTDEEVAAVTRDYLLQGLDEYLLIVGGNHRYATWSEVPRHGRLRPMYHITAGGMSWGDDPFDGFTGLGVFLSFLSVDATARADTNFVCWGVPAPDLPLDALTDALTANDPDEIAAQAALLVLTWTTPTSNLLNAFATHPDPRVREKVTVIVADAAQE